MKKIIVLIVFVSSILFFACRHIAPAPPDPSIVGGGNNGSSFCFNSDVQPIFLTKCATAGCHDAITAAKGYKLDTYANIISKDIRPFDATDSKIYTILFVTDPTKKCLLREASS